MMTRPDIAEPASVLGRFNSNPGMTNWKAVKHLLRYLAGTLDMEVDAEVVGGDGIHCAKAYKAVHG